MRFREIVRRLTTTAGGAGPRYAAVATELLRLLDGGANAAVVVKARRAENEGTAVKAKLPRTFAADGSDGAAAVVVKAPETAAAVVKARRAADSGAAVATELLRLLDGGGVQSLRRPARSELAETESGTEPYRAADAAAASRAGPQTDAPEEEEELTTETRYGERLPEDAPATRPRRPDIAPAAWRKARRKAEDAEAVSERRRLGAALEALSRERSRLAVSPVSSNENGNASAALKNGVPPSGAAAFRDGDTRSGGAAARNGARARSFNNYPSSGAAFPGGDPEAVSEFFRRDSRRYDAGFGGVS